jgi:hypothetical protein
VFSLLKPGIDAARVAGGAERVEGAPLDPFTEMVICKLIEMTFESIPGGLAQAIFLLNGDDWTTAAVVSVGLSCVSTAFIATTVVYDFDTDPTRRKSNPELYGLIPDNKRALVFALLFLYHTAWSLGKTFSMAVLAQTDWVGSWCTFFPTTAASCATSSRVATLSISYQGWGGRCPCSRGSWPRSSWTSRGTPIIFVPNRPSLTPTRVTQDLS